MIFAIEGIDASGKATQSKLLAEHLGAELFTFPDYTTPAGKVILSHLKGEWLAAGLSRHNDGMGLSYVKPYWPYQADRLVLQSLMATNRLELGARLRAAASRKHVVCDRYDVSGLVYGTLDGVDRDWLVQINAQMPVTPDVRILIDITVEESFRRRPERRDAYELDRGYLEKVRALYVEIFKAQFEGGTPWYIVDGMQPVDDVQRQIRSFLGAV